ncbi:IspD/TarI family cytidylyltransferase [Demequina aestuarii]|uniref:IspD/TarI family cytidylyltransferase n=1 Tax=Demequina aestuarii TaxID=327095 RepID=UPI000783A234|nr:IspD/TarI family cytidylyltransferase [Demequina aestuarii]
MIIAAVITAAGSGTRLAASSPDGAVPKALVTLDGRALVAWAVTRIADVAERIVVTAPALHVDAVQSALADAGVDALVVPGGDTRQASVAAGLSALALDDDDIVLIHDAARAFQEPAVAAATIEAVRAGADGAIPVLPVVDTLIGAPGPDGVIGEPVDREGIRAVQTPQTFRAAVAIDAHRRGAAPGAPPATDDATLARALGHRIVAVAGHEWGFKVTRPSDLPLAHHIARSLSGDGA